MKRKATAARNRLKYRALVRAILIKTNKKLLGNMDLSSEWLQSYVLYLSNFVVKYLTDRFKAYLNLINMYLHIKI